MAKEMNMEALQANLRMMNKKSEMAFEQAKAAGKTTPEQEKLNALLNDAAFIKKFLAAETAEEAQNLFKENGLEISLEELNGLAEYIAGVSQKLLDNGGEISEEELELIAGGSVSVANLEAIVDSFMHTETGAAISGVVGGIVDTIAHVSANVVDNIGIVKGVKTLGNWISSWF